MVCEFGVSEGRGRSFDSKSGSKAEGTWMSVAVPGGCSRRRLWGFAQWSDHTWATPCCPPWGKTVATHGLKLLPVARVPSKADFRLFFREWKRFALNRNSHELG